MPIKGLDGRPTRNSLTLEEILKRERQRLESVAKEGKPTQERITSILSEKENAYKERVYNRILRSSEDLETKLLLTYKAYSENPYVLGIVLSVFLEGFLRLMQDIEIMEGTPQSIETASSLIHEIHHIPTLQYIQNIQIKTIQTLISGSTLLESRIKKRREDQEDDRISNRFIYNPRDLRPSYKKTHGFEIPYKKDDIVMIRQMVFLQEPDPSTSYNLGTYRVVYQSLGKVFTTFSKIVEKYHTKNKTP